MVDSRWMETRKTQIAKQDQDKDTTSNIQNYQRKQKFKANQAHSPARGLAGCLFLVISKL